MAILGDDDLLSLRVSKTNNFKEILVLEIDKRICDLINNLAKKNKLNINVIQFDIRAPLPTKILNKYDIVFTDIPYSAKAFAVFVSRAIHLLKKGAGFHIFVSSSPLLPSIKTELEIQKVITKMNIYLVEKIHMANHKIPKRLMKKYNSFEKIKEIVTLRTSTLDKWYLENLAREEYLMQFATTEKTTPYIKNTFYYGDMYE
jgi:predicted methyltransferase